MTAKTSFAHGTAGLPRPYARRPPERTRRHRIAADRSGRPSHREATRPGRTRRRRHGVRRGHGRRLHGRGAEALGETSDHGLANPILERAAETEHDIVAGRRSPVAGRRRRYRPPTSNETSFGGMHRAR